MQWIRGDGSEERASARNESATSSGNHNDEGERWRMVRAAAEPQDARPYGAYGRLAGARRPLFEISNGVLKHDETVALIAERSARPPRVVGRIDVAFRMGH